MYHGNSSKQRNRWDRVRAKDARATLPRSAGYIRPYWKSVVLIGVCLVVGAGLIAVPPLLIREIIDVALPQGDRRYLNFLILGLVVLPIGSGFLNVLQSHMNATVSQRMMFDIRNELYVHLQGLSLPFFTKNHTGEVMSRLNDDVSAIQGTVTRSLIDIANNSITVTITLVVIFSLNWQLALLSISLLPMFIIPARLVGRLRRQLMKQTHESRAELATHMQETLNISGYLLMKIFNREKSESDRFRVRNHRVMDLQIRSALVGRWFFMVMGLFSFIGPALIYFWGGHQMISGALTVGTIVAFVAYLARLYGPVQGLATVYVDVQAALALFERIFEYLDTHPDVKESHRAVGLSVVRGQLRFDRVSFEYVQGRSALRDVSFEIESNQLAALVGPTGAGKTTVTYLIPRFYDPTGGSVSLDGMDLMEMKLESLRSQIGMVTQETFLFNSSIRDNVLYSRPDASEVELLEACQLAHMHDFVSRLPDGYETMVGERGYRLSGGEKQRLAIARVILKRPRILILDEATSHLDSLSESLIRLALEPLLAQCTSVVVAHRLSTILRSDIILVLDEGEIVERGTHAELLGHGGLYKRIYEEQFRPQEELPFVG